MSFGSPLDYDAGLAFNYDVWTPGTRVSLTQVPWDSVYRDTVLFASAAKRDEYLAGNNYRIDINSVTYLKRGEPVRLSVPYGEAVRYNYMVVENPAQPIGGDRVTKFFYFIQEVEHVNPETTRFVVQLDVFQTYMYSVRVNRGFVVRGHVGFEMEAQVSPARTSHYLDQAEGIDTGDQYVERGFKHHNLGIDLTQRYMLAIATTVSFKKDPGTKDQPISQPAASSVIWGNVRTPVEVYFVIDNDISSFFSGLSSWPWVAQGIFNIVVVPMVATNKLKLVPKITSSPNGSPLQFPPGNVMEPDLGVTGGNATDNLYPVSDWENIDTAIHNAYTRVAGNSPYLWMGKFKTFPYCYLTITDGAGSELVIRPELLFDNKLEFASYASLVPGNEAIRVVVKNYLANGNSQDYSLTLRNLPTLPALNDNAAIAVASQARSTQAARESVSWAQNKSLRGNEVGATNATLGLAGADTSAHINQMADIAQTELGNRAASQQALLGVVAATGAGASGGAMAGGAGAAFGAASGAVSGLAANVTTMMQNNVNSESLGLRNSSANAQRANSLFVGNSVRDNNKGLADWAAKGDYANQIGAITAKTQDMQMIPASMSGMFGGEVATWAMRGNNYRVSGGVKTIANSHIVRLGQTWARYGYYINRYMQLGALHLMTRFTYWQMLDVHISGVPGMTEGNLNALRGMFERGVTLHRTPDSITDYNLPQNRVQIG